MNKIKCMARLRNGFLTFKSTEASLRLLFNQSSVQIPRYWTGQHLIVFCKLHFGKGLVDWWDSCMFTHLKGFHSVLLVSEKMSLCQVLPINNYNYSESSSDFYHPYSHSLFGWRMIHIIASTIFFIFFYLQQVPASKKRSSSGSDLLLCLHSVPLAFLLAVCSHSFFRPCPLWADSSRNPDIKVTQKNEINVLLLQQQAESAGDRVSAPLRGGSWRKQQYFSFHHERADGSCVWFVCRLTALVASQFFGLARWVAG